MSVFARMLGLILALACALPSARAMGDKQPAAIQQALDHITARSKASRSDALLVMRGDEVLLEHYTTATPEPIELMSVTKSVVALVVAHLMSEGTIASLDTPVAHWYPEWQQGRKKHITLRMLMDHTSGLQNMANAGEEIYPASDVVQLALSAELDAEPGEQFSYNNKAVNLLAGIVERASGQALDTYAHEHVFVPLGIQVGVWQKDSAGHPHVMAGLSLTARDAARLGRLLLDRGRWEGTPLIDSQFIEALVRPSERSGDVGLLWWLHPAWVRFSVDERTFALLEDRGIDAKLVAALDPLRGRSFDTFAGLSEALSDMFGADWRARWNREVVETSGIGPYRAFNAVTGPVAVHAANGYLGQFIVVIPAANLIGVRQIREREDYRPSDGFADFTEAMTELAVAINPSIVQQ